MVQNFIFSHNPGQLEKRRERLVKSSTNRKSDRAGKRICNFSGCSQWAMKDGSGFCYAHNPATREKRKAEAIKVGASLHLSVPVAERKCGFEGCRRWGMQDESGWCYLHSPDMQEKRKASFIMRVVKNNYIPPPQERNCKFGDCQKWSMDDGSGFCYAHNPAMQEKWGVAMAKRVPPPERACRIKGCSLWNMQDGSGLCHVHHKETIERLRKRMKGNKNTRGHHLPWLRLKNFEQALGLIFYSLENDKPLLTLRALTKIASLHAHGLMYLPKRKNEAVEESEVEEKERPEMFYLDPASWKK